MGHGKVSFESRGRGPFVAAAARLGRKFGGEAPAQHVLLHLGRRGVGKRVNLDQVFGQPAVKGGDHTFAHASQRGLDIAVRHENERKHAAATGIVQDQQRGIGDAGHAACFVLDECGTDQPTRCGYCVLQAIEYLPVAIGAQRGQVARAQPAFFGGTAVRDPVTTHLQFTQPR